MDDLNAAHREIVGTRLHARLETDPETLTRLCAHPDVTVRAAAAFNSACPPEGQTIAALLGLPRQDDFGHYRDPLTGQYLTY